MIKAVAKRKLGFVNKETKEIFEVLPYTFVTLPDWAKYDPMYEMAVRAGILELHETISAPVGMPATDKKKPEKSVQSDMTGMPLKEKQADLTDKQNGATKAKTKKK